MQVHFLGLAIIKMTILPRLLYLMRTTPIKLPQNLFKSLHSILLKCLWKHKRPRIKFAFLPRSKEHGGIGLPYFKNDYLVSHLMRINDWHCHTDTKVWVSLGVFGVSSEPLQCAPWIPWNSYPPTLKHHLLTECINRFVALEINSFRQPQSCIHGCKLLKVQRSDGEYRKTAF